MPKQKQIASRDPGVEGQGPEFKGVSGFRA